MLKLVSIHINKAAGTSFEWVLRNNYHSVFRINTHFGSNKVRRGRSCNGNKLVKEIPPTANVIHGHFKAVDILTLNAPVVTWVRDPVDRVISNYFYTQNSQTLLNYASQKDNQNRMSKMISGLPLNQFFFIGISEYFDEDLVKLGTKLGWKNCIAPRLNTTKYKQIDNNTKNIIRAMNNLDEKLYNEVLRIRSYA